MDTIGVPWSACFVVVACYATLTLEDCDDFVVGGAVVGALVGGAAEMINTLPDTSVGIPSPTIWSSSGKRKQLYRAPEPVQGLAFAVLTVNWMVPARHPELPGSHIQDEEQLPPTPAVVTPTTTLSSTETAS